MLVSSDSTDLANGAEQVPQPSNADLRAAIEDLRLKLAGQDIKLASQDAIIRDLSVLLGAENEKSRAKTEHHEVQPPQSGCDVKAKIKKLSHKIDHQIRLFENTDEQLQDQAVSLEQVEDMVRDQNELVEAVDSRVHEQGEELRGLRLDLRADTESFQSRFDRLETILEAMKEQLSSQAKGFEATSKDIDSEVIKTVEDKIDDQAAMIDRLEDTVESLSRTYEMDREDSKKELDEVLLELSQLRKAQQALETSADARHAQMVASMRHQTDLIEKVLATINKEGIATSSTAETAVHSGFPNSSAMIATDQSAESLAASHKAVLAQLPNFHGNLEDHTHAWLVKVIKVFYTSSTHQKLWVPLAAMKFKGVAKVWWTLNEKKLMHASWDQFITALSQRPAWEIRLLQKYLDQKKEQEQEMELAKSSSSARSKEQSEVKNWWSSMMV